MTEQTTQQNPIDSQAATATAPPPGGAEEPGDAQVAVAGRSQAAMTPAAASLGIVGRHRMPAVVVVLSILTLGLYTLVWHARVNREMSDFDTRMHVAIGRTTWAVTVPWLLGLASSAAGGLLLAAGPLGITVPFGMAAAPAAWVLLAGLAVVPWLELLIPFSLVAVAMTAERVRICQDRVGLTRDVQLRPAASTAWLLVPVVGRLVLMARLQSRLNAIWERVAPPASSRAR